MMFDVITIGSAVQDVFVSSKKIQIMKSHRFQTGLGECLALGAKLPIDKLVFGTGGGATNTAVTFARAGFKTACICKIGKDIHGGNITSDLEQDHIDTRWVVVDFEHPTGYSVILTAGGGDRSILTFRSASGNLSIRDIPWQKLKSKWFYISSLGGNFSLLSKIVDHARQNNVKIAFNPGGQEIQHVKRLTQLLRWVDIFLLNSEEAALLTQKKYTQKKDILRELCSFVKGIAVMTDGNRGAYACHERKMYYIPTKPKKVLNSTGAGDAFGSGFVAGWILKNDIEYALQLGLLNAESVVQHIGAKVGIIKKIPTKIHRSTIQLF